MIIVGMIALGYLFCAALKLDAGNGIADPSLLTKGLALALIIISYRLSGRRVFVPRTAPAEVGDAVTPTDPDQRWLTAIATLVAGQTWLLDDTLRVVIPRAPEGRGQHVIDLVGNEGARSCLALIAEAKRCGVMVRAPISIAGEEISFMVLPFARDHIILMRAGGER